MNCDLSQLTLSLKRASMLISENMTAFDPVTNMTNPRITETYEAILFTAKGGYFVVDGQRYEITKGTVRFLRPGQVVYSKKYNNAYVIYFSVDCAEKEFVDNIKTAFTCSDYNKTVKVYQKLIKCYVANKIDLFQIYCHLCELINIFMSDSSRLTEVDDSQSMVELAKEFMNICFMNRLSLKDIAQRVNLHPNYFHRLFKSKTGLTPFDYLTQVRINTACDLLVTTTNSISDISQKCGFDNPSYFISVFKSRVGITPYKYRKRHSHDELL